ncbi:MAG TPA: sigma-70 family RNA polymerase sigma factor [Kofleriaceae bacterium]|nr:sigma-70 family RNA polymerase sigma factor [Kofleriaceae bacterium]
MPAVTPMEDAALVAHVAGAGEGARPAEQAFVERYAARIRRYAERHLRDRDEAADLVQEVLVVVLTAMRDGRIEQPDRLGSFVLTTCRHLVWDENRAAARRRRLGAETGGFAEPATPPPVEPIDVRRIERCARGLGSREQSVVVLTYCEDWPADRIAAVLGTTAGNVRVIRHRALAQLAACLAAPEAER